MAIGMAAPYLGDLNVKKVDPQQKTRPAEGQKQSET
jgi:hypothetical protein